MGIFQSIFSQDKTLSAELKSALEANFTKQNGLYRNKDGSLPRLKEFQKLGFDADQYSNLVYGISQKSLQNQLLVPAKLCRVNKRNRIEKLFAQKNEANSSHHFNNGDDWLFNESMFSSKFGYNAEEATNFALTGELFHEYGSRY